MPSYLHPGVYVEEIPSGSKPIEGVATSIAAFVGVTQRNSQSEPVLIGSFDDYQSNFGPLEILGDPMGLSVQAFYRNGGGSAYICPMSTGSATASVTMGGITIDALGSGPWANQLYIRISEVDPTDGVFDLEVGTRNSSGTFYVYGSEKFEKVSLDSTSDDHVDKSVNGISSLVSITVNDPTSLPSATSNDGDGDGQDDGESFTTAGAETSPAATDYTSFYNDTLRKMRDVSIIVLPGVQWTGGDTPASDAIVSSTRAHCDKMKNRVLIIDPPEVTELRTATNVSDLSLPTSTYTVLYYPWVGVANPQYHPDRNPSVSTTVNVAPSAIAAGMWAKIDAKRGVWKAPAGVEAQLVGASSLRWHVEDLEQDQLNPSGINCYRKLPGFGSVVWGARTLATRADPEWRYVPVRRTAIYIKESIYNGIQWAVFEPNDHRLWASLRANIGNFMNGLFRAGAFQGEKASDAYFVRCNLGDTMTQADIDTGKVIVVVGFAPLKPAEFVIVRIQQKVNID